MKYNEKKERYELSTGNTFYANNGIIGISPDSVYMNFIYDGYDGYIDPGYDLSKEEQLELCDFMIDLWKKRKEKIT